MRARSQRKRDPLANPEPLIRRVYAYAAYHLGDGVDAEDATSEVFENALRYRDTYDPTKGEPIAWLIGIARRCVVNTLANRSKAPEPLAETEARSQLEGEALDRLTLDAALSELGQRDRDLLTLRYEIGLQPREIAAVVGMTPNAAAVAVHRALGRLRDILDEPESPAKNPTSTRPQGRTDLEVRDDPL